MLAVGRPLDTNNVQIHYSTHAVRGGHGSLPGDIVESCRILNEILVDDLLKLVLVRLGSHLLRHHWSSPSHALHVGLHGRWRDVSTGASLL